MHFGTRGLVKLPLTPLVPLIFEDYTSRVQNLDLCPESIIINIINIICTLVSINSITTQTYSDQIVRIIAGESGTECTITGKFYIDEKL